MERQREKGGGQQGKMVKTNTADSHNPSDDINGNEISTSAQAMRVSFFHHLSCLLGNRWFWGKEKIDKGLSLTRTRILPLFADKTLTVFLPLPPPPLPQSHQWPRRQCCCGESVLFPLPHLFFLLEKYYTTRTLPPKKLGRAPPISVTWSFIGLLVGWRKIRFVFGSFFTLTHTHTYYALACNQRT